MISVAIDGPAGSGKSTIAKEAAKSLSYIYVDTGALYRAVAYYMIKNNILEKNMIISVLGNLNINLKFVKNEQRVFLLEEDVSDKIRSPEVSMEASKISAIPEIREFLLSLQQKLAKANNVIMDGRDIGTVVLPNADVKIFITALPEIRAKRRYDELIEKGIKCEYKQVLNDIIERDKNDSNRTVAPLKMADDAICVDTSNYSLVESVELVLQIINSKVGKEAIKH